MFRIDSYSPIDFGLELDRYYSSRQGVPDPQSARVWTPFCDFFGIEKVATASDWNKGPFAIDTEDFPGDVFDVTGSKIPDELTLRIIRRNSSGPVRVAAASGQAQLEFVAMSVKSKLQSDMQREAFRIYAARLGGNKSYAGQFRLGKSYTPPFGEVKTSDFNDLFKVAIAYTALMDVFEQEEQNRVDLLVRLLGGNQKR